MKNIGNKRFTLRQAQGDEAPRLSRDFQSSEFVGVRVFSRTILELAHQQGCRVIPVAAH